MRVELIYDADCPNVEGARSVLKQSFARAGIHAHWMEWDRSAETSPDYVEQYGSPTILVNGQDVAGPSPKGTGATCRLYAGVDGGVVGVPSAEAITDLLQREEARSTRSTLASLPVLALALLPKLTCPACWPAYAGLLSFLGLGFFNYTPYLLPLTSAFLLIAVVSLGFRAKLRHGYGPLGLGFLASATVLVGKFGFNSDPLMYSGIVLLAAALLWNSWPRRRSPVNCPACQDLEEGMNNGQEANG